MPIGVTRVKYKVNTQDDDDLTGKQVYAFNLNDGKEHIFSMYNVERKSFDIQIQNMDGDILAHHSVSFVVYGGVDGTTIKAAANAIVTNKKPDNK
jgi:hypothetical protein